MSDATGSILLVDDELPIRLTLGDQLRRRGFVVETAENGEQAVALLFQRPFDVLVVDLKMPGMDGIEVARRARERQPEIAVLVLTGHGSLESAIEGIHLGVFDYMLKTTPPREVVERVKTALAEKRSATQRTAALDSLRTALAQLDGTAPDSGPAPSSEGWISIGDLHISTWKQTVRLEDQVLALTPTEFRVLTCLAQQAGQVMTYQQILRCAQDYDADTAEAAELIKPHIYHLRQKIEPEPGTPRYILTVRGTGYMLAAPSR